MVMDDNLFFQFKINKRKKLLVYFRNKRNALFFTKPMPGIKKEEVHSRGFFNTNLTC